MKVYIYTLKSNISKPVLCHLQFNSKEIGVLPYIYGVQHYIDIILVKTYTNKKIFDKASSVSLFIFG